MWERIGEIVRKEVLESMRENKTRLSLFLPPLIQLVIFGYAVNLDLEHTRIAWMDMDRTPASRELGSAFAASRYFEVVATPEHEQQVQQLMDRGRVQAVIRVLPGFARDIQRGETAGVQILVDGTNSNTASLVSNYANLVVAGFAARASVDRQRQKIMARSPAGPLSGSLPSVATQPAPAVGRFSAVPDELAGGGAVYLDCFEHSAAGHDLVVLFLHAGFHAERLHVPDSKHAGVDPGSVLLESGAVFHGDRARH